MQNPATIEWELLSWRGETLGSLLVNDSLTAFTVGLRTLARMRGMSAAAATLVGRYLDLGYHVDQGLQSCRVEGDADGRALVAGVAALTHRLPTLVAELRGGRGVEHGQRQRYQGNLQLRGKG